MLASKVVCNRLSSLTASRLGLAASWVESPMEARWDMLWQVGRTANSKKVKMRHIHNKNVLSRDENRVPPPIPLSHDCFAKFCINKNLPYIVPELSTVLFGRY